MSASDAITSKTHAESNRLRQALSRIRNRRPTSPQRDAAADLGVTEAQLVAAHCGHTVTRLRPQWGALVADLEALGTVRALTRNGHAVLWTHGSFRRVAVGDDTFAVSGRGIELRAVHARWHTGYAVRDVGRYGARFSLQFFDAAGVAVHKVIARPRAPVDGFERFAERYAAHDQSPREPFDPDEPTPFPPARSGGRGIDLDVLRDRWHTLRSGDDLESLADDVGLDCPRLLRLVGERRARRLEPGALRRALEIAARRRAPIEVSVASSGAVQRYAGPVGDVRELGGWLNAFGETVGFHVRAAGVAELWLLELPGADTREPCIAAFDRHGGGIARLSGAACTAV